MHALTAIAVVGGLLLSGIASAWEKERVLLILDNQAQQPRAAAELGPVLHGELSRLGYDVVGGPAVQRAFLDQLQSKTSPAAAFTKLQPQFRAESAVVVTIDFFLDQADREKGPDARPAIGLSARRITPEGRMTWRGSYGSIEEPVRPQNGRAAKPRSMVAVVAERLLWTYPKARLDPVVELQKKAARVKPAILVAAPKQISSAPPRIETLREKRPDLKAGPRFRLKVTREGRIPSPVLKPPPPPGPSEPNAKQAGPDAAPLAATPPAPAGVIARGSAQQDQVSQ